MSRMGDTLSRTRLCSGCVVPTVAGFNHRMESHR
jgi:hypothetical protein